MDYSALELQRELEGFRALVQTTEHTLRCRPLSAADRADVSIQLALYKRRVEGLSAELRLAQWKDHPFNGRLIIGGEEAEAVLRKEVDQWHSELPDWKQAHDKICERLDARQKALKDQRRSANGIQGDGDVHAATNSACFADISPAPIIWKGTATELGDELLSLFHQKKLQADTGQQAVREGLKHFLISKDGGPPQPINADSVYAMLSAKDAFRDPGSK